MLAAVYALGPRPGWVSAGELTGAWAFGVIASAQGVLIAALAAVGVWLHRRRLGGRTPLRGFASPAPTVRAPGASRGPSRAPGSSIRRPG
ncbi:hypothetical protein OG533_34690 [Streptomyces sp. NBC_01186]|uniref:hypothetical protein n=1 Tax=Streptomyces sp. NBC_01186 TaxID=2903765 RepID=UPI002E14A57E|nr:hypothetical protein OG533_34690 [Streptomyces sp. NBC_01186]